MTTNLLIKTSSTQWVATYDFPTQADAIREAKADNPGAIITIHEGVNHANTCTRV